jgi:myosin heavy subunit
MRNVTQESIAPSQKTILLPQPNGVYQSHVKTERLPLQARNPLAHHSHINDRKMGSPARVSFDYNNSHSIVFNSYIPMRHEATTALPSKMAPCISERQFEHGESVAFWREKYEELNGRW